MTTVGILGGGQLGRMLALAGYPLGFRFKFLCPHEDAPAGQVAPLVAGPYDDPAALDRFIQGIDVATYEFENVPEAAARRLASRVPVYPPPAALATAQDRLQEKTFFQKLGIPVPPFAAVDDRAGLEAVSARVGLPAVLKTRRLGYDGKGQYVVRTAADIPKAWDALGGAPLELEGFVPFDREVSVIAARGRGGEIVFYPLMENRHQGGILRLSIAPAPDLPPGLQARAEDYARRVLEGLDYVGVLAIELFLQGDRLLANEMACRVHNSGHWTIEGAETSQFENHLRAVAGLPLGSAAPAGCSAMVNLIGELPEARAVLERPGVHLHLYGKEPRAGRKLGHATLRAKDAQELKSRLPGLLSALGLTF